MLCAPLLPPLLHGGQGLESQPGDCVWGSGQQKAHLTQAGLELGSMGSFSSQHLASLTQLQAWCEQQGGNLQNNDFHFLPELGGKATLCFYLFFSVA